MTIALIVWRSNNQKIGAIDPNEGIRKLRKLLSGPLGGKPRFGGGTHCILEVYDCPSELLDDVGAIVKILREAAEVARSTVLNEVSHEFAPQGVTAFVLLAESHISIHTWPEIGYAAIDAFTCGETAQPERACQYLIEALQAGDYSLQTIPRGVPAAVSFLDRTA